MQLNYHGYLPVSFKEKILGQIPVTRDKIEFSDVRRTFDDILKNNVFSDEDAETIGIFQKSKHKTVKRNIGGKNVAIDRGIVELVDCLNSIDGVQTTGGCEGRRGRPGSAYITFECTNVEKWPLLLKKTNGNVWMHIYADSGLYQIGLYFEYEKNKKKMSDFLGCLKKFKRNL